MSLLIVGATGTLGRQIALQALTKGYKVRCLVRNFNRANFLKEWGAELVYGDLTVPETIPACLKGISVIFDASTSRPDDFNTLKKVDWDGKLALIDAAEAAKIDRFIFCSAQNLEQSSTIPLIKMKYGIENQLKQSNISYTIFRLPGFYQGLIEQYAIPILENLPIWVTNENIKIPYMDTQDIAKFFLKSLQLPKTINKIFILGGPKSWLSAEIISLCEQLAGQSAKVNQVPVIFLKLVSEIFGFFAWGQNISDRLAFVNILLIKDNFLNTSLDLYKTFKIEMNDIIQLNDYFLEYFVRLLKKLRDINFEDIQKQRNLII
uniref:NmrA-like domain-containing protein n=1 Tax=Toxarium undulatum TaxID=210620 RepID=A0A1D8D9D9_9STRA|nr:hypothetical protein [Toxarium undulatum]AOS86568.1 hypothetical protein [Toxarium undulatum]